MSEKPKTDEINQFTSNIMGLVAVAHELTKDAVSRGEHKSSALPKPVTDGYGTFSRKWDYTEGFMPLVELSTGKTLQKAGEVRCTVVKSDGTKRIVTIGKTPAAYSPDQGGQLLPDAGDSGEYLLAVADIEDALRGNQTAAQCRYLDESELVEVRLAHGEGFTLAENTARGRQITVEGVIESTSALLT